MHAAPEGLPRRAVLERGVWGGLWLTLLAPGCEPGCGHGSSAAAADGSFDAHDRDILLTIARRVIRPPPAWPTVEQVEVVGRCERQLELVPAELRRQLRSLLRLFDAGTLGWMLDRQRGRFTKLDGQAQDAVLRAWQTSRWQARRSGGALLRDLCVGNYYVAPEVWPHLGYPGPPEGFFDAAAPVWRGEGQR